MSQRRSISSPKPSAQGVSMSVATPTPGVLERMNAAINAHDIEAFMSCFAENYSSEQPLHPERAFSGKAQVRANWTAFFANVPDMKSQLSAASIDGDTAWAEWHWTGTRKDGNRLNMRGVVVSRLHSGVIHSARLYMEPVQVKP